MSARRVRWVTRVAGGATAVAWVLSIVCSLTGHIGTGLVMLGGAAIGLAATWLSTTPLMEAPRRPTAPKRTVLPSRAALDAQAGMRTEEVAVAVIETEDDDELETEDEEVDDESADTDDAETDDAEIDDAEIDDAEIDDDESADTDDAGTDDAEIDDAEIDVEAGTEVEAEADEVDTAAVWAPASEVADEQVAGDGEPDGVGADGDAETNGAPETNGAQIPFPCPPFPAPAAPAAWGH